MLKLIALVGLMVLLAGGGMFGWGWYLVEQREVIADEADRLKAAGDHAQAEKTYRLSHETRDRGTNWVVMGMITAGVGGVILVPALFLLCLVPLLAPRQTFATIDEVIAWRTEPERLRPGEQVLNTAHVIRQPYSPGDRRHLSEKVVRGINRVKPRWDHYAVAITNERLLLVAVQRSLLAKGRFRALFDEEYATSQIVDCTTDQHWKGRDVILHFPQAYPMLLRLFKPPQEHSGNGPFWQEVPRRFGKPPAGKMAVGS